MKIAVVGAGAGGLIVSNRLAKALSREIEAGKVSITIFDSSTTHEFQPSYLGVAFKGKDPSKVSRPVKDLLRPEVKHVQRNCEVIDIANRFIITKGDGKRYDFDKIVIATGSKGVPAMIPGLIEANHDFHTNAELSSELYKRLNESQGGKFVVGIAGLPHKCPPSPDESAFLLEEFLNKNGLKSKSEIYFITPYTRAYPAEVISEVIAPIMEKRGIKVITNFNLDSVDAEKKELVSMEGQTLNYDHLMLVPPHMGAEVFRKTDYADEDGWIKADKRDLHINGYDYAFAIGDVTNIAISKAGVEAHLEGIVVANNIISEVKGSHTRYLFTGRTHCSMETGYRQATFVIGTYTRGVKRLKPTMFRYLQKKFMEKIYWASLMGRFERVFKLYFGKDYYDKIRVEKENKKAPKKEPTPD